MIDEKLELRRALDSGVPYLGHALHADQGHHRFAHFPAVVELVRRTIGRTRLRILEIGSWAGASLIAWARACDKQCELVAVDHWEPYIGDDLPVYKEMTRAAASGEILALFEHNLTTTGIRDLVRIRRGRSEDVLLEFTHREEFDIVFVDGDHRYERALFDIAHSSPLVRVGGVLCGDDLEKQYGEVSAQRSYAEALAANLEFTVANDGIGYHPGVTRAVHEVFGETSVYDGLWAKQKFRGGWKDVCL